MRITIVVLIVQFILMLIYRIMLDMNLHSLMTAGAHSFTATRTGLTDNHERITDYESSNHHDEEERLEGGKPGADLVGTRCNDDHGRIYDFHEHDCESERDGLEHEDAAVGLLDQDHSCAFQRVGPIFGAHDTA